jgi:hypothetical protein
MLSAQPTRTVEITSPRSYGEVHPRFGKCTLQIWDLVNPSTSALSQLLRLANWLVVVSPWAFAIAVLDGICLRALAEHEAHVSPGFRQGLLVRHRI